MKKIILGGLTLALLILGTIYFNSKTTGSGSKDIVVYQSRTCGCCKKWVEHLRSNGLVVRSEFVDDVDVIKREKQIPRNLASCHTAIVDGYIVEGHVPASAIEKMLTERPNIKGITVPGMPMGSPGMEGHYKESYDVLSFDDKGETNTYMRF